MAVVRCSCEWRCRIFFVAGCVAVIGGWAGFDWCGLIHDVQRTLGPPVVCLSSPSCGWSSYRIHSFTRPIVGLIGTLNVVLFAKMSKWIFENIIVVIYPKNSCDSRAPHSLRRPRGGSTPFPHSSPSPRPAHNGCRAKLGERGASLLRE